MIEVAGLKIFFVDFHCQWMHKGLSPLFLAGLSYLGFDAGVMVVPKTHEEINRAIKGSGSKFLAIRGQEYTYNWGHIISVGYSGKFDEGQADFRETLRKLQKKSKMVIFAHPMHLPTKSVIWDSGLTDKLLDEGLFDAIELVNSYNLKRDPELIAWYNNKIKNGSKIPITGGCDVHYLQAEKRPPCIYSPDFPPCGKNAKESDIDHQGSLRTLVIANECTEEAIVDAVKNSRTLIETDGKLFGPPELVKKLLDAGYWKAVEEDLKKRRALCIIPQGKLISGAQETYSLQICSNINKGVMVLEGKSIPFSGSELSLQIPRLGDNTDEAWIPLCIRDTESNVEMVSAINVIQPVDIDFFGIRKSRDKSPYIMFKIKNNTSQKLSGKISCTRDGIFDEFDFTAEADSETTQEIKIKKSNDLDIPNETEICVELNNGWKRNLRQSLTFTGCRYTDDPENPDWSKAEEIRMDRKEQVALGNWDGPQDASARIKLLWSTKGLHILGKVKDNIHVQPFHGGDFYQGDAIQIGIDAFLKRGKTQAPMYEFLMGLSDSGSELFCTIVPTEKSAEKYNKPMSYLPADCIKITKSEDGLIYETRIPWDWLKPFKAEENEKLGFFILLFDNDGEEYEVNSGCKSIMLWPCGPLLGWKAGTKHWAAITLIK